MASRGQAKAERVSVRTFARMIGVSHQSVQKAIRTGRLRESVGYNFVCPRCGFRYETVGKGPADPGCFRCLGLAGEAPK